MNTGEVSDTAVPAAKQQAAREGGFNGDDEVEAVDDQWLVPDRFDGQAFRRSCVPARQRARCAGNGQALTFVQAMTVAHQFDRRMPSIIPIEEPAQFMNRAPYLPQPVSAEQDFVVGTPAAVSLFMNVHGHQQVLFYGSSQRLNHDSMRAAIQSFLAGRTPA